MTPELAARIDRVRADYGDLCFACGRRNPLGLHLDGFTRTEDGWVSASFSPRDHYRGAGDTLHGGVAATALDEILVWAGILTHSVMTVTGTLEIRYRRRLTIADTIVARARVEERRGRRLVIVGHLDPGDGPAVEARGLYLVSREIHEIDLG